ncbi:MAG: molybdopterin-dependent oxidoreductase [Acidobacteriia bacterium]|nr:molybdopterin-dependent oxidoreductase [Terriglobia bacterium]
MRRRDFVKLGAGIVVACRIDPLWAFQGRGQLPRFNYPTDFNAYLRVGGDGRVTCYVGKVELGQGSMTALTQLVAEELSVAPASIDMVMGDTDLCPWDLGTFGSMCIPVFGPVLRRAAVEAREVLRELAAERLQVPAASLEVKNGSIFDPRDPEKTVTFASLADGKAITRHVSVVPPLKDPASFSVIGQSLPRRDATEKVTGRAKYSGDLRLPGMLYAKIVRPPAHGAKQIRVDTSAAASVQGALVVRDGDLVAVLHEQPDEAARALALIAAEFERGAAAIDDLTIFDHLVSAAPAGQQIVGQGNLVEGERAASAVFEETFLNAYVAHATMETHTALATIDGGKVTVWASTQAPFMVKTQVADSLGVPPDRVRIITPFVGGGFGGKTMGQQAVEAARLARATGRPVQVAFDRREEFFYDTFRPAATMKLKAAIDGAGKIVLWSADVYGAGEGGAAPIYDIPHQRVVVYGGWQAPAPGLHPFGVGAWRAPAFNSNTFARELLIDRMAASAGLDPLTFRLNNLSDPRMRRVLQTAADRFGWVPSKTPSGRGVGMACGVYSNTYVATFAEVTVDGSGQVRVKRVVCAQDMGVAVNPQGARTQIEGAITMGLGYALSEEIRFRDGEIADRGFDTYRIPRFSWLPKIDAILVDSPDVPPSAGGEPAIICMGAVIGNAIHDATGGRLFQLPLTPARVREARMTHL